MRMICMDDVLHVFQDGCARSRAVWFVEVYALCVCVHILICSCPPGCTDPIVSRFAAAAPIVGVLFSFA